MSDWFEIGDDGLCQFERNAMDIAERVCWQAGLWFQDERHDARTEAWIVAQARKGTPATVATIAIWRVRGRRHFNESIRSIDHPLPEKSARRVKLNRVSIHVLDFASGLDDPAELVAFWMDFERWRRRLNKRLRNIVRAFLKGLSTQEAANRFQVSPGRISQIRKELQADWESQFAEED